MSNVNYLRHTYEVALKMQKFAKLTDICDSDVAYMIGYFHDIGKEFLNGRPLCEHNKAGEEILNKLGFKYANIVGAHGDPESELRDLPLVRLLNYCDLTISNAGEPCSVSERLDSVILRYGKDSKQHHDTSNLIQVMSSGGWTIDRFSRLDDYE